MCNCKRVRNYKHVDVWPRWNIFKIKEKILWTVAILLIDFCLIKQLLNLTEISGKEYSEPGMWTHNLSILRFFW